MQGLAGNRCLSPGSLICKWHCFLKGLKQTDVPGHLPLLLVSSHSPGPRWLTSPAAGGHLAETCARGAVARCGSGREPGGAGHDALLQPRGSSQCSHQPKRRAEALLNMSAVRTALHLDLKGNNRLRRPVPSTRVTSHRLPPRWNQPWATQKEQKLDLKDVPVTQLSTSLGP